MAPMRRAAIDQYWAAYDEFVRMRRTEIKAWEDKQKEAGKKEKGKRKATGEAGGLALKKVRDNEFLGPSVNG